jgi:hypothetical protein
VPRHVLARSIALIVAIEELAAPASALDNRIRLAWLALAGFFDSVPVPMLSNPGHDLEVFRPVVRLDLVPVVDDFAVA